MSNEPISSPLQRGPEDLVDVSATEAYLCFGDVWF